MNKKDLMDLGVPEDIAEKAVILHGKDIESLKGKVTTYETEVQLLKGQLGDATTAIDGFKGLDVEGIKHAADEWKEKAEQAQREGEERIFQMQFEHSLENELLVAGARNTRSVMALLDFEKLDLNDDGTIKGLSEQLAGVVQENPFLFDLEEEESEEDNPQIVTGSNKHSVIGDPIVIAARKAAGLKE